MPISWSSPTRLDSIGDLETIFDRADTGSSDGAWALDTAGSTTSGNTGPGTNSSAPYVYSETSSGSFSTIPVASTLTVKAAVMTAWTGADRQMLLRASIQGAFSATEGLEVEGRAADSDDWTRIELLEGWAYSDGYASGGTVTDAAGDTQIFSQVGGWIDFAVTIPDAYTQVRIHTLAISGGNFYEHDIALWRMELLDGTAAANAAPTISFATAAAIVEGASVTTITGTVADAEDDDGAVTVRAETPLGTVSAPVNAAGVWSLTLTAPAVAAGQQQMALTVTAEDSGGLTAAASRTWTVRANRTPTVMITTPAQTVDAGATVSLAATAMAPETGQTVTIAWTADGGSFTDDSGASASWDAPSPTAETGYTITATATDALGEMETATVQITVRAIVVSPEEVSLFDDLVFLNITDGMVWLTALDPVAGTGSVVFVDGSSSLRRAGEIIDPEFTEGGGNLYVNLLVMNYVDNRITMNLSLSPFGRGTTSGDNFTAAAIANLGIAFRGDSITRKYRLSELSVDPTEPYLWTAPAGQEITQADVLAFRAEDSVRSILVDISNSAINWDALTLTSAAMPSLPAIDNQVTAIGLPFSLDIEEGGGGNPPHTYSVTGPDWLSLTGTTISGTPSITPDSTGPHTVTVSIFDANNDSVSQAFTLTVTDSTPALAALPDRRAQVGIAYSVSLPAAAGGEAPIAYSLEGNPSWLILTGRTMAGTPDAIGEHEITYTAADNDGDSDSQIFTLRVGTEPDTSPIFSPSDFPITISGRENTMLTHQMPAATGGNAPIAYTLTGLPAGLAFEEGPRIVRGTPTEHGTFTALYEVFDVDGHGGGAVSISVIIAEDLMPTLPLVADQTATEGQSFSLTLPEGTGGDPPLRYTLNNVPPGLTFTGRVLSGTPTTAGDYSLDYSVLDDDGSFATVSFIFVVLASVPTLPAVPAQSAVVGAPYSYTFAAAMGADTPLTYSINGNPAWLTLSGRTIAGTPDAAGTHTITITVADSDGDVDSRSFVLTVIVVETVAPGPPEAVTATVTGQNGILGSWAVPLSGGGVHSYSLRHRREGTSAWQTLTGILGTSQQISGLLSATIYELQVQAVNNIGESAWTPEPPVSAMTTTPVTPTAAPVVAPDVLDQPPIVAPIDAYAELGGGLQATVNAFRHILQGGAESAEIAVAGPLHGLLSLLGRIRHPVRLTARRAGTVWSGYVHRVEVETGAMRVAASVDGMRTAVAVEYPRPDTPAITLRSADVLPVEPQTSHFGRIVHLASATSFEQRQDADFLAGLTADFLEPSKAITQSRDGAVGATLFCRGWATALGTTLAPRYAAPSRIEQEPLDVSGSSHARTYMGRSSSTREVALWLPVTTTVDYDLYAASVRVWIAAKPAGYSGVWQAGLSADRSAPAHVVDVDLGNVAESGFNGVPSGGVQLKEMDFSEHPVLMTGGGVWLHLQTPADESDGRFDGAQYLRAEPETAQPLYRRDTVGSGTWTEVAGAEANEFEQSGKPQAAYDVFCHARADGLLQFVAQASGVVAAAGQPGDIETTATYTLYLEGRETIASVLRDLQGERIGWVVDETRAMRAVALDERVYHLAPSGRWSERVARGSPEMVGQVVEYRGSGARWRVSIFSRGMGRGRWVSVICWRMRSWIWRARGRRRLRARGRKVEE